MNAIRHHGLMIHCAGIEHQGNGYLFLGVSGSGKTTIARHSHGDVVLNDDLILLTKDQSQWIIQGTPFSNPSQNPCHNASAKLRAAFHIVKDTNVFAKKIDVPNAVALLIAGIPVLNANPAYVSKLFPLVTQLSQEIPLYELHFRKDTSFWKIIDNL